jgi:hypothetical protein
MLLPARNTELKSGVSEMVNELPEHGSPMEV